VTEPLRPPAHEGREQEEHEHPVVRDRRRIDPVTGQVRDPGAAPAAPGSAPSGAPNGPQAAPAGDDRVAELEATLAERTADLQRVQAEYANYRRRVERDRQAVAEQALASVLTGLLPVLDDIDRARAHGESSQGFTTIADGLDTTLTKLGLERFGSAGEPFDPTVHEALTHLGSSPDVDTATCAEVYQPGYRVGERILRPARVAVTDPEFPAAASATDPTAAEETTEVSDGSG
jgi:molecular chaperone GrpE